MNKIKELDTDALLQILTVGICGWSNPSFIDAQKIWLEFSSEIMEELDRRDEELNEDTYSLFRLEARSTTSAVVQLVRNSSHKELKGTLIVRLLSIAVKDFWQRARKRFPRPVAPFVVSIWMVAMALGINEL